MANNQAQRIVTVRGRASYLYAYTPQTNKNDDGQEVKTYHADIILASQAEIDKVKQAQREVAELGWPGSAQAVLAELAGKDRLCLKSGAGKLDGSGQPMEAYKDKFFVSANSKAKPSIFATIGGKNVDIPYGHPCAPYSGAICNFMIAIYPQGGAGKQSKFGRRINAQLMGLQFLEHGEAFGGGRVAKPDEFGLNPIDADGAAPAAAGETAGTSDLY